MVDSGKVRTVVVGVGHLGRHHARIVHESSAATLVAVVAALIFMWTGFKFVRPEGAMLSAMWIFFTIVLVLLLVYKV